jgi:hypothetical protein
VILRGWSRVSSVGVFLLLYLIGVGALLVALFARTQPLRAGEERVLRAVLVVGTALSVGGAIALSRLGQQPEHSLADSPLAFAVFGALAFGGAIYALGVVMWCGVVAFALRAAGWVLMMFAVGVPSTLLLGFPFVCTLAVGVRRGDSSRRVIAEGQHHDPPGLPAGWEQRAAG